MDMISKTILPHIRPCLEVFIVIQACSHVSQILRKDKVKQGEETSPKINGILRYLDAFTHLLAGYWFNSIAHCVLFMWHVSPFYFNMGSYSNNKQVWIINCLDTAVYVSSVWKHVPAFNVTFIVGCCLYIVTKLLKLIH